MEMRAFVPPRGMNSINLHKNVCANPCIAGKQPTSLIRKAFAKTVAAMSAASFFVAATSPLQADPAPNIPNFSLTTPGAINTTVPDGTCGAAFIVNSGGGGSSGGAGGTGGQGGASARISAAYKVLPLQSVTGTTGQGGQFNNSTTAGAVAAGGTGYSAGGNGGLLPTGNSHRGAGGGGSSIIRIAGNTLIIAGGGGGGGAAHSNAPTGNGGDGGFTGIAAGASVGGSNGGNGAGGAGETVGGGGGGTISLGGAGGTHTSLAGFPGSGIGTGTGGNGAADPNNDSGGGGGAGYTGGGGGASTVGSGAPNTGGGGGGGSSFLGATSPTGVAPAPTLVSGVKGAQAAGGVAAAGPNGSVTIDWIPCRYSLSISKAASPTPVKAGAATVWTVSVTNTGPDAMTRGDTLTLADTLPVGPNGANTPAYRVLSIATIGGSDANLDATAFACSGVTVGSAMPASTVCSRLYSAAASPGSPSGGTRGLNSGETLTITYEQVISNKAVCSTITNRASTVDRSSLSGTTDILGVNSSPALNAALDIQCYDLGINKSVAPTAPNNNDTVTWNVVVTNNGTADMEGPNDPAANPLIVTDAAPTGAVSAPTAFTSTGPAGACTYSAGTINCPSSLPAGQSQTFTFAQTVNGTAAGGTAINNSASVTDPATGDSNDTSNATATVTSAPKIGLVKTAGAITDLDGNGSDAGDTVAYSFAVTNMGNVNLSNITINDPKVTVIGGPLASLAAGNSNSSTFSAIYTLTQADVNAGGVSNQATVIGSPPTGAAVTDLSDANTAGSGAGYDDPTLKSIPTIPSIGLIKTAGSITDLDSNGPDAGDTVNYIFTVRNTGNVTLTNVTVTDPLVTVVGGPIATLAPGESNATTFVATYTLSQADVDAGGVTNQATATGKPPTGADVTDLSDANTAGSGAGNTDPTVTAIPTNPSIGLVKTAGTITDINGNGPDAGDLVSYSFAVTNTGNVTLTNVIISDPLVTVSGGPLASLAPGVTSSNLFTATYTLTQANVDAGSITNQATATGMPPTGVAVTDLSDANTAGSGPGNTDPTVTPIPAAPLLSIDKLSPTASFNAVGDVITYSYVLTNIGNVTLNGPVSVNDNKTTVSCPALPVGGLAPGATHTCAATYSAVQADLNLSSVINIASGTIATAGHGNVTSGSDKVTVPAVQSPALSVVKTATSVNFINIGDLVTYDYVVTNSGNVNLTAPITVTDNRVTPVNCPSLPPGGLAPAATLTCTATYSVKLEDLDIGSITNLATAASGPVISPQTSETVPAGATPALTIDKGSTTTSFATLGQVVPYTFTVTNSGNATFTRVINVVDDKIGTIACFTPTAGDLTFTPGESTICNVNYTVKQADLDAGLVTNQAYAATTYGAASIPVTSPPDSLTINAGQSPALNVTKSAIALPAANVGQVLTYTIMVANTGNVTVSSIVITDPLIPSLSCSIATLAPGASNNSCTGSYTITQANVNAGGINNTATANGITPQGNAVSDTGSLSLPIAQVASIGLIKNAGTITDIDGNGPDAGDTVSYTFTVKNTGNVSLTNISVSDPLVTVSGGPLAILTPGASNSLAFMATYTLTQADVDAGGVSNQATATGKPPTGANVTDLSDATTAASGPGNSDPTVSLIPSNPSIGLVKTAGAIIDVDGNGPDAGDTVAYAFTVSNTGNVTLNNITVSDPLVTVSGGLISLFPGNSNSLAFSAVYTLTQADIDAGGVSNQATATGKPPTGPNVTDLSDANTSGSGPGNTDPTVKPIPASPSIGLVKTAGTINDVDGNGPDAGDTVNYAFTVANTGNVTLTNITVSDPLVTVIGGPLASLAPASSNSTVFKATYTLTQADVDAGNVTNQAIASGAPPTGPPVTDVSDATTAGSGPGNGDPTVTSIPASPSIGLVKSAGAVADTNSSGRPDAGDTLNYTFTVTNTGNVTLANIVVTDPLVTVAGGPVALLAPGASNTTTFTAAYTLTQADMDAGGVSNQATASGIPPIGPAVTDLSDANTPGAGAGNDDPTLSTIPTTASIAVVKTTAGFVDTNGSGSADPGDVITYSFAVTNTGVVVLSNVSLSDPLAIVSGGPLISLAPGITDAVTFTASYTLTQADIDAGNVNNQAIVTGTPPSGPTVTDLSDETTPGTGAGNDDVTVTPIPASPLIGLVKTAGAITDVDGNGPDAGDTLAFAFTVTNTGNVTLTGVTITDPLVTIVGGPLASLAPGIADSSTFSATYTLTQADVDAGRVNNQATAAGTPPSGTAVIDLSDTATTGSGTGNDDPTSTPITSSPAIGLVKSAGSITDLDGNGPDAGDTISYGFVITNMGNVTLSNITLSDAMVTVVGGPVASLAPGATDATSFSATYTLTQGNVDNGGVSNQATVSGVPPTGPAVTDVSDTATPGAGAGNDDPTTTPVPSNPSIGLVKSAGAITDVDGNGPDVGDAIVYSFAVTNTGNVTLTNIAVSDPLVAVTGGPTASLAPGATDSTTFMASYTLTQTDVDAGAVNNQATASGNPPTGPAVTDLSDVTTPGSGTGNSDPTSTPIPSAPSIGLVKTAGAITDLDGNGPDAGDTVNYALTTTNTGNVTLNNVTVTDPLVQSSSLERAGTTTVSLIADAELRTPLDVQKLIASNQLSPELQTASITLDDKAALAISRVQNPRPPLLATSLHVQREVLRMDDATTALKAGDTVAIVFALINSGEGPLTTLKVTQASAEGYVTSLDYLAPNTVNTQTVVFFYTLSADDVAKGAITTPAEVSFEARDQALSIAVDRPMELSAPRTLDDILTASILPASVPSLAPGSSTAFTGTYTLTQADLDAGQVINTAQARGIAPNGGIATDTSDESSNGTGAGLDDPTVVPLAQSGAIDLVKTAGTPTVNQGSIGSVTDAGDTITYTFAVTNTGNVTLSGVAISDAKVGSVTCPPAPVAPAASANCTATYIIKQLDLDAGLITNTATVTAKPPAGADVTDISGTSSGNNNPTITALAPSPAVTLVKTAAAPTTNLGSNSTLVDVGDTIAYSFLITNIGNVTITSVGASDAKIGTISCPVTILAPAASTTCTGSYAIQQIDIDLGSLTNTATATGRPPFGAPVSDVSGTLGTNDTPTQSALPQNPAIGLVKTAGPIVDIDGNGPDEGDEITYTFTVFNLGNTTLLNIGVSDPLATVQGGPLASLLPSQSDTTTFSATYTLTQADVNAGEFSNLATVSGTPPVTPSNASPTPVVDTSDNASAAPGANAPTVVNIPQNPGVALVKLSGGIVDGDGNGPDAGDTINYTFQVTNTGNVTLTNIRVTDPKVTLSVGPLATLEPTITDTTTFKASYTLTQDDIDAGQFINTAKAVGTPPIGADTEDTSDDATPGSGAGLDDPTVTSIAQTPDIRLVKTATEPTVGMGLNPNLVDAGDTITYRFEIINRGNITLRNVTVTDALAGMVLTGTPVPVMRPGDSNKTAYTGTYTIKISDITAGGVSNTALATGEYNDRNNIPQTETDTSGTNADNDTATRVPLVATPGIALIKTAKFRDLINPPKGANLGDAIEYGFEVINTGNLPITGLAIIDPLPGLGAVTCPSTSLAVGGTIKCTAPLYMLTQADLNIAEVRNQATANGTAAGGTPVSDLSGSAANNDAPTVTGFPLPPVTFTKSASVATAAIGDTITYTIRASGVVVQPVEVVDNLPSGLTYVRGSVTINDPAATAAIAGRTLTVGNITPQGVEREVTISLRAVVNTSAQNGTLTNRARIFNSSGQLLGEATAKVEIRPEPVFDCGDIIGKVFDDRNGNGIQDAETSPYEPERGLPGVRVVTAKGELITTDKHGRFHIACADVPDGKIGSNFIVKVDPRSLPSGYRLTTENPRVVRLTKGKLTKVNFGASISRVIRFNLSDKAFADGQIQLPQKLRETVIKVVAMMTEEPSLLRLQYQIGVGGKAIAQRRLEQAEAFVRREWDRVHPDAKLPIETRLLKLQQDTEN
jgi:uncharacterized repeat protein (TIGR01451 family)